MERAPSWYIHVMCLVSSQGKLQYTCIWIYIYAVCLRTSVLHKNSRPDGRAMVWDGILGHPWEREGGREGGEKVLHSRQNINIPEVHYTQLWYEKGEGEYRYTNI